MTAQLDAGDSYTEASTMHSVVQHHLLQVLTQLNLKITLLQELL